MSCENVRDLLPLYVEEDVTPAEAAGLREHLAGCEACRADEEALRASQAFWQGAPAPEVDPVLAAEVRRAVRLRLAERREARARWWSVARAVGALAGAAAAVAVGFLVLHRAPERPGQVAATATPSPARAAPAPPEPGPALVVAAAPPAVERAGPVRAEPERVRRSRRATLVNQVQRPAAAPRVTRIEMATENPNVRIIWLAKAGESVPL